MVIEFVRLICFVKANPSSFIGSLSTAFLLIFLLCLVIRRFHLRDQIIQNSLKRILKCMISKSLVMSDRHSLLGLFAGWSLTSGLSLLNSPSILGDINPLSAIPTKWSNTLKQFVGCQPKNCLSMFGYFVGLALKGLRPGPFLHICKSV